MTVDRFTREQFEATLPSHKATGEQLWEYGGCDTEHFYFIPVIGTNKRIVVRSSIGRNGISAEAGGDSIRHWVEYRYKDKWLPLAKDTKDWTTRVPGWEHRLHLALQRLWQVAVNDSQKGRKKYGKTRSTETRGSCQGKDNTGRQLALSNAQQSSVSGHGVQQVLEHGQDGVQQTRENKAREFVQKVSRNPRSSSIFDSLSGKTSAGLDDTGADESDAIGTQLDIPTTESNVRDNTTSQFQPTRKPNAQQQQAIFADINKPLRLLAGPGAGKTFVMGNRYGYLLSQGIEPQQIVLVTFTRSMADEGLERICKINPQMRELHDTEPDSPALRQINTIHGLCLYMLREEGDKRIVPGSRSRVKYWQVKAAIEDIALELWQESKRRPAWKELLGYIETAKNHGLTSEHDMEFFGGIRDKFGYSFGRQLHVARSKFDGWLRRNGVMLFSDMLFDVQQKLRNDAAFRERWQKRITHVLVDEGQDTNFQSMQILTTLASPQNNITIVGDTDQLLFRFLNATPEANLFEGFEAHYPENNTIFLETNYRSTQQIISTYSKLIRHNYSFNCEACEGTGKIEEETCSVCGGHGAFNGPYNVKYFKHIKPYTSAEEGEPVTFTMYEDATAEAKAVALRIKEAIDGGVYEAGDFFVGARTRAQTGYLEGPLVQFGIPYINLVGSSFWDMKHVNEFISYLALAVNEEDNEAFETVYNIASSDNTHPWGSQKGQYCNHRYLGKKFLEACTDKDTRKPSYKWRWQAAKRQRSWNPGVEDLDWLVNSIQRELAAGGIVAALKVILEDCYEDYLRATDGLSGDDNDSGKIDDLATVIDVAKDFDDVNEFLIYVQNAKKAALAAKNGDWQGHVVISTYHRLKGLQRAYVIGVGFCEGRDKQNREVGLLPHTYSLRPPDQQGVLPTGGQGRIEDERDIAYVLVSRAQKECHLTGCTQYRSATMWPSRFIEEMELI